MYTKLGANIRGLRKSFGETQLDLAYALGLNTATSVSNYESGKRLPDREMRVKIAKHYRITEEELVSGNFEGMRSIAKKVINDQRQRREDIEKIFPLVYSQKALENMCFAKGYELQLKMREEISKGMIVTEAEIDECFKWYEKASDEGVIEAEANALSWYMIFGFSLTFITPEMYNNLNLFVKNGRTVKDAIKYGLLPSFDGSMIGEEASDLEEARTEFVKESRKEVVIAIYKLKHSKEYAELADYYTALCYKFGLINNSLSLEMNMAVGEEMMFSFSLMGNKYADKFLGYK